MFSYIRKRASFVNVIAVIALVFAMTGGALAAKKYLITSTKQISPKVLAQLKKEAKGANGAQGAVGPAGQPGNQGPKGDSGANGSNGQNGSNGSPGPTGQTGFTKTLPSGETETGTWSVAYREVPKEFETWTAISFPIPLEKPSSSTFFINALETEEIDEGEKPFGLGNCAGTLAHPTAPKGELCVYTEEEELVSASLIGIRGHEAPGYEPAGGYLDFRVKETGTAKAHGNWAVTAP